MKRLDINLRLESILRFEHLGFFDLESIGSKIGSMMSAHVVAVREGQLKILLEKRLLQSFDRIIRVDLKLFSSTGF